MMALAQRALRFARARRRQDDAGGDRDRAAQLEALSAEDRAIVQSALPYTMTGVARLQALIDAVRYLVARDLDGVFVECGVWRGGSVLAMLATLKDVAAPPREVWLYDTFEGMTEPTEHDVSPFEPPAVETWRAARERGERPWSELFGEQVFSEPAVRETLLATGYPEDHLHFVAGPVEQTLPANAPDAPIALMRLDTDWYESTRHELEHLYPRLVTGGVLIVDDYGHFAGAQRAVDEYLQSAGALLLHRIDYTGRIAIKV